MDWKKMLKSRWFQIGAVVAVTAGFFALYQRRSSSGGTSTATGAGTTSPTVAPYSGLAYGSYDSSGTDIASWLGDYSGSLQQQLTDYSQLLQSQLEAFGQLLPQQPQQPQQPAETFMVIGAGQDLDAWIRSQWSSGRTDITFDRLMQLNPDFRENFYLSGPKANTAKLTTRVRVT